MARNYVPGNTRCRRWCFTINKYTEDDLEACMTAVDDDICKYIVFGLERAPTTGTPHIQGYLECKGQKSRATLSKAFPRASFIISNGDPFQAAIYCVQCEHCKHSDQTCDNCPFAREPGFNAEHDEGWFEAGGPSPINNLAGEDGTFPRGQGKRNDIHLAKEIIKKGGGMCDVIDQVGGYQAMRAAELMLKYLEPRRNWKPVVIWLYGRTGLGKSKLAKVLAPEAFISGRNLKWWYDYDAHENVIIDDFRADFCTFHELLRILDRYPYIVETKGGSRQLLAQTIVITSPYHPEHVYAAREDIGQLLRRIDKTIHVEADVGELEPDDPIANEIHAENLARATEILARVQGISEVEGNNTAAYRPASGQPHAASGSIDPPSTDALRANNVAEGRLSDDEVNDVLDDIMGLPKIKNMDQIHALADAKNSPRAGMPARATNAESLKNPPTENNSVTDEPYIIRGPEYRRAQRRLKNNAHPVYTGSFVGIPPGVHGTHGPP